VTTLENSILVDNTVLLIGLTGGTGRDGPLSGLVLV